jgi:hypothetical protein
MPVVNIARHLFGKVIQTEIDSLNSLGIVDTYIPVRSEATPQALRNAYEIMLAKCQHETEIAVTLKAAADDARQAEWDFHNAILAI